MECEAVQDATATEEEGQEVTDAAAWNVVVRENSLQRSGGGSCSATQLNVNPAGWITAASGYLLMVYTL